MNKLFIRSSLSALFVLAACGSNSTGANITPPTNSSSCGQQAQQVLQPFMNATGIQVWCDNSLSAQQDTMGATALVQAWSNGQGFQNPANDGVQAIDIIPDNPSLENTLQTGYKGANGVSTNVYYIAFDAGSDIITTKLGDLSGSSN